MVIYGRDQKLTTMNSIFTWQFLVTAGSGARINRRSSAFLSTYLKYGELMSVEGHEGELDWSNGPPNYKLIYLLKHIGKWTNESTWYSHNRYGNRRRI